MTEQNSIKVLSLEADEFFKIFLHDALVVYSTREVDLDFASTAEDAIKMLEAKLPEVPDIIFLSLSVPPKLGARIELLGGMKVLRTLREHADFKKVPIIVFSRYGDHSLKRKAKKLGATRYFVKGDTMPRDIAEAVACADKINMNALKAILPWKK